MDILKRFQNQIIVAIIVVLVIGIGIGILITALNVSRQELTREFDRLWSSNASGKGGEEDLTLDAVVKLETYLIRHPKTTNARISMISEHLHIVESGELRVIEYIENPEFYGDANKRSFLIFQFRSVVKLLSAGDCISVDKVIQSGDNTFLVFASDYHISGQTGLRIIKIIANDMDIQLSYNIVNDNMPPGFEYIGRSLYCKDSHIYIDKTSAEGDVIHLRAVDINGQEQYFGLNLSLQFTP